MPSVSRWASRIAAASPRVGPVVRASARGESPLERLVSLVLLGDLVSLYLAVLRGVDPEPVELLSALKAELAHDA